MRKFVMHCLSFGDVAGQSHEIMKDSLDCVRIDIPVPPARSDEVVADGVGVWVELARACRRIDTVSPACWLYAYSDRPREILPLLWYRLSRRVVYDEATKKYYTEDGRLVGPRPFIPSGVRARSVLHDYIRHIIDMYSYDGDYASFIKNLNRVDDSGVFPLAFYLCSYRFSVLKRDLSKTVVDFGEQDSSFSFKDCVLMRRYAVVGGAKIPLTKFIADYYASAVAVGC